jgi:hypothetical protein
VRYVDVLSDPNPSANGISVFGYGAVLVEENVLDIALNNSADNSTGKPARFRFCVSAEFFANQSSQGTLAQGWNNDASAYVNELSTNVEDSAVLAF